MAIKKDEHLGLEKLKSNMDSILKSSLYINRSFECCPICGAKRFIKYGLYNGIQRYQCKECHKTFSKAAKSIFSYSKKSISLWSKYIELFLEKKTLRKCAAELEISLTTAFYWRHKILNALKEKIKIPRSNDDVFVSTLNLVENIKHTYVGEYYNYYQDKDFLMIAAMKMRDEPMKVIPVLRGRCTTKSLDNKIQSCITKNSFIIPYNNCTMERIARKHNEKLLRKTDGNEQCIKSFPFNFSLWFGSFKGVGSKYLQGYLDYFTLFNLEENIGCMEFIDSLKNKFNFIRIIDIKKACLNI